MRILLIAVLGLVGCGGAEQYPALEPPKPVSETKIQPKSADDFARILATEQGLIFADRCGYAGAETPGWLAMEGLVRAGRLDLLEQALRSTNTVGRLYAVLGIREVMKLGVPVSPETQAMMKEVTASKEKVTYCSGCIVDTRTAANAYADFQSLHPEKKKGKLEKTLVADVPHRR